jgi:hypothetical protein
VSHKQIGVGMKCGNENEKEKGRGGEERRKNKENHS